MFCIVLYPHISPLPKSLFLDPILFLQVFKDFSFCQENQHQISLSWFCLYTRQCPGGSQLKLTCGLFSSIPQHVTCIIMHLLHVILSPCRASSSLSIPGPVIIVPFFSLQLTCHNLVIISPSSLMSSFPFFTKALAAN